MIVNTSYFAAPEVVISQSAQPADQPSKPGDQLKVDQDQSTSPSEQEPIEQIDEAKFWKQMNCLAEMSRIEVDRKEVEQELKARKDAQRQIEKSLSDAKEEVREMEEKLRDLTDAFLTQARAMVQLTSAAEFQEIDQHNQPEQAQEQLVEAKPEEDEGWRRFSIAEVLKVIPGQKAKKEKVADQFKTVGEIQDARIEASLAHKQFKEVLPKGCGEGFATAIEDAIIDLIKRWNKQKFSPGPAINLDAIANEIRQAAKLNEWTKEDCQPKESDSESLKAGFLAFNAGKKVTDAPTDSEHAAKQWLTGWVSGEILKSLK